MAKAKARAAKAAWRSDRISTDVNPDTGLRVVDLPDVPGMTTEQRDALYAFEAGAIGTTRAVIRMQKRALGVDLAAKGAAVPYLVGKALEALPAKSPIRKHYA